MLIAQTSKVLKILNYLIEIYHFKALVKNSGKNYKSA